MKLFLLLILPFCLISSGWAARRALVIGNAGYSDSPLRNPVNDANLVANTLRQLGFEVSLITNADHQKMDTALNTFVGSIRDEDEVLFYYSGHGANYAGENFLIPIGRVINAEEELRYHAFSSNLALERMQRARLSIMVLDACRDNPFRGARSGNKGLQIMQGKAGSQYIIYSTEQGKTAADGTGANSPFTESFVKHIGNSDRIEDIMKKVTREVKTNTFDKQIPWTAGNLIEDFYFAKAAPGTPATTKPAIKVDTEYTTGSIRVESNTEGEIWIDGSFVANISSGMIQTSSRIGIGSHSVELKYQGKTQSRTVSVLKDQTSEVVFAIVKAGENMILVPAGTFGMGSKDGDKDEKPVHQVTVSSFYIGKYEVTQKEWAAVMGSYPSHWKGETLPVERVSWYAAIDYCNKRSLKEGLKPCYSIDGNTEPSNWSRGFVVCDWNADGYRLPTEAEWEYAARGGNKSKGYKYSGSNDIKSVAWYSSNSGSRTKEIGTKSANELGIHDLSGNVWEWCWDWYESGYYGKSPSSDPRGASSGDFRVLRGGSWYSSDNNCRVAYRNGISPGAGSNLRFGFRVFRTIH